MPAKNPHQENDLRHRGKGLKTGHILIVDPDQSFVASIEGYFQSAGFHVYPVRDSFSAQSLLKQMRIDVALINISLLNPLDAFDYSGIDLAINLQAYTRCIMMAKNPTVDMVRGALATRMGSPAPAYEFISKRWSVHRMLTLINSVLKMPDDNSPVSPKEDTSIHHGMTWHPNSTERFKLDLNRHLVIVDDKDINLSEREYRIILYLMNHPERVVSGKEIVEEIFDEVYDPVMDRNRINNIISRLRKKIEKDPHYPEFIMTAWGKGWLLYPDACAPEIYRKK